MRIFTTADNSYWFALLDIKVSNFISKTIGKHENVQDLFLLRFAGYQNISLRHRNEPPGQKKCVRYMLFYLPRAAIMAYYKRGGFKQQKCIVSQFWSLESEITVSEAMLSLKAPEEHPSSPLPASGSPGFLGLWQHYSNLCFCLLTAFPSFHLLLRTPDILD